MLLDLEGGTVLLHADAHVDVQVLVLVGSSLVVLAIDGVFGIIGILDKGLIALVGDINQIGIGITHGMMTHLSTLTVFFQPFNRSLEYIVVPHPRPTAHE